MELFTKSLVLVSYLPRKKRLSIQSILDMFLDMFPKMRFPSNHSVKGAAAGLVVGLGVRAVRAGSIGRDRQRIGETPHLPISEAGGLCPALSPKKSPP
jgi:hypothetical protein